MERMIEHLYDEIRNIERFRDDRMLVATADLEYHWKEVLEKAERLEDAFAALREEELAAEEADNA